MTDAEIQRTLAYAHMLLPPDGVTTTVNGVQIQPRKPVEVIPARLLTEAENEHGMLRWTDRNTEIAIHEVRPGETRFLFEMGIPVTEIGDRWHYDIAQKIPLTMDRENVRPGFLRQVRLAVFNRLHGQLSQDDVNSSWVKATLEESKVGQVDKAAAENYLTARFGAKRVIYDPNDKEANNRAVAEGYTVISGGMMKGPVWEHARATETLLPAGKVTPSAKPYDKDGEDQNLVLPAPGMQEVERYSKFIARRLLNSTIIVSFVAGPEWPFLATYGPGRLTFNVSALGSEWFNLSANRRKINELLIHELGHHYSGNHLSEDYYAALCRIGAGLAELDLDQWSLDAGEINEAPPDAPR